MSKTIIVDADTKEEAYEEARHKLFHEGGSLTVPAVPTYARPVKNRPGKYEVTIRKDKRY